MHDFIKNLLEIITTVNDAIIDSYPTLIGIVLGLLGLIYSFECKNNLQLKSKQRNLENMYLVIFFLLLIEILTIVFKVIVQHFESLKYLIMFKDLSFILNIIIYKLIIQSLLYVGRRIIHVDRTIKK